MRWFDRWRLRREDRALEARNAARSRERDRKEAHRRTGLMLALTTAISNSALRRVEADLGVRVSEAQAGRLLTATTDMSAGVEATQAFVSRSRGGTAGDDEIRLLARYVEAVIAARTDFTYREPLAIEPAGTMDLHEYIEATDTLLAVTYERAEWLLTPLDGRQLLDEQTAASLARGLAGSADHGMLGPMARKARAGATERARAWWRAHRGR